MSKCSVSAFLLSTPIGILELTACKQGLHKLLIKTVSKEFNLNSSVFLICKNDDDEKIEVSLKQVQAVTVDYFVAYFEKKGDLRAPNICWSSIATHGSFTEAVLKTLFTKVKMAQRVSYKQLAELSGAPNAYRAVGTVMGKNQIPILIPCHRVIKNDGSLGNYSGGSGCELKKWLLEYEMKPNDF